MESGEEGDERARGRGQTDKQVEQTGRPAGWGAVGRSQFFGLFHVYVCLVGAFVRSFDDWLIDLPQHSVSIYLSIFLQSQKQTLEVVDIDVQAR